MFRNFSFQNAISEVAVESFRVLKEKGICALIVDPQIIGIVGNEISYCLHMNIFLYLKSLSVEKNLAIAELKVDKTEIL